MATKCGADPHWSLSAECMGGQRTGRRRQGALLSSKMDRPAVDWRGAGRGQDAGI